LRIRKFWMRKRPFIRWIVFIQKKNDIRPFTVVQILGLEFSALLDSGANKSVSGGQFAQQIIFDKPYNKIQIVVRTEDGQIQSVASTISISISIDVQLYRFKPWILLYNRALYAVWISGKPLAFPFNIRIQSTKPIASLRTTFIQCTEVQAAKGDRLLTIIRVCGPRFDQIDRGQHWHIYLETN